MVKFMLVFAKRCTLQYNDWIETQYRARLQNMALNTEQQTTVLDQLTQLLGDRVTTNTAVRDSHGKDESWHHPHRPDLVVFPKSTEEVSEVVKICAEHMLPVVAYGTGTSLEGNVIPHQGGVVVDLMHMDRCYVLARRTLIARFKRGSPESNSTSTLKIKACFFQSTQALMHH